MKAKFCYWINQCYLMRRAKLKQLAFDFTSMTGSSLNNKQLLDEVFVISRIIKFEVFLFLRFSQFFRFHVISKQLLCHLRRPFCVCESLSSTTFSMSCSVNEANLEVMFLLLH